MSTLTPSNQPVVYSNAIQIVLGVLVTLGWLRIDSTTVDAVATAVGALLAVVVGKVARGSVIPLVKLPALPAGTVTTSGMTSAGGPVTVSGITTAGITTVPPDDDQPAHAGN
jgi:hypothetical protein